MVQILVFLVGGGITSIHRNRRGESSEPSFDGIVCFLPLFFRVCFFFFFFFPSFETGKCLGRKNEDRTSLKGINFI